jgi:hypothetical protein
MKKQILFLSALVVISLNAFAQGTLTFANIGAPITNDLTGLPVAGTVFRAALYYLPATGAVGEKPPTPSDFDHVMPLNPSASFLSGGVFNAGTRTAPTTPAGGFGWFQVKAWETAFGTSYEQAIANPNPIGGRFALVGTSNIIRVNTADPTVGIEPTPTLIAAGLKGFCVGGLERHAVACGGPVPEPLVFWLGCFGLSALLVLSRRKN